MISKVKFSLIFLVAILYVTNAELTEIEEADDDADVDIDDVDMVAKRAPTAPGVVCKCPPANANIVCKENQNKESFLTNDICKCTQYRCVWEVCPEVKDVQCKRCQVKVEVDDCGCKQFECREMSPKHCPLKLVKCSKCSKLVQEKDACGCPNDKCVPIKNPPSKCPCKDCQMCKDVETGPEGCGLKESICVPVACPPFEEVACDLDCEKPELVTSKCGCPSMKCVPLDAKKVPECDECQEPRKRKIEKCGFEKYECVAKRCDSSLAGKEMCYDKLEESDSCGCPLYERKTCLMVPAGECPADTVAQGGFDTCGCPHQICVPCKQVYPQTKECKKCEKAQMRPVANGRCKEAVCVATPECDCPRNEPASCGECEQKGRVRISEHCVVNACVPSEEKSCVCKDLTMKKKCGKCETMKKVKSGRCAGVKACSPMAAGDCPKLGSPKCPPCQRAVVESDECGCKKYVCKKEQCPAMAKRMIKCDDNKNKKKATVGVDACKCQIQTCVDQKTVCEEPNPFAGYGQMVFRAEKYGNVDSLAALKNPGLGGLQTDAKYTNLATPLSGAWIDKDFVQHWNQRMKGPKTKVRFTFWKREGKTAKPVVDYIFNGEGTNVESWFARNKVLDMKLGPNVKRNIDYLQWSAAGDDANKRNFFVNKNYGGCGNDFGFVVVLDKIDVCSKEWMGGKGGQSFPRFLYASNPNGCKWADANCAKEADIFTIAVL